MYLHTSIVSEYIRMAEKNMKTSATINIITGDSLFEYGICIVRLVYRITCTGTQLSVACTSIRYVRTRMVNLIDFVSRK